MAELLEHVSPRVTIKQTENQIRIVNTPRYSHSQVIVYGSFIAVSIFMFIMLIIACVDPTTHVEGNVWLLYIAFAIPPIFACALYLQLDWLLFGRETLLITDAIVSREIDTSPLYPLVRKKSAPSRKLSGLEILDRHVYPVNDEGRDMAGVIAFVASGKRFRFGKELDRNEAEKVLEVIKDFAARHHLQD